MTDELVERVAWAIAEVLAKRHGSGHTAQGWMGEARREEARAIIPIVQDEQRERDVGRTQGWNAACDALCNWLNSFDTEGMTATRIRSAVYAWGQDNITAIRKGAAQ